MIDAFICLQNRGAGLLAFPDQSSEDGEMGMQIIDSIFSVFACLEDYL